MTAPAVAAARFCIAGAVGMGLGCGYDILRPLRRKHHALPDLIFVVAMFYGWLYVNFSVCQGDLRLAWLGAMALGGILWEGTAGWLLRPVFFGFWQIIGKILRVFTLPVRKTFQFFGKFAKITSTPGCGCIPNDGSLFLLLEQTGCQVNIVGGDLLYAEGRQNGVSV